MHPPLLSADGPPMLLVIDNYDSFTWNLVQYLGELGTDLRVVRNDERSVEEIRRLQPDRIVLSPGPRTPADAGVCVELVRKLGASVPSSVSVSATRPSPRPTGDAP